MLARDLETLDYPLGVFETYCNKKQNFHLNKDKNNHNVQNLYKIKYNIVKIF